MPQRYVQMLAGIFLFAAFLGNPSPSNSQQEAGWDGRNSIGINLVRVEPGTFLMGNPEAKVDSWDEQPVHKAAIRKPFYISETEITVEQFRQFRPDFADTAKETAPATGLSWYDAVAFCEWLSGKEGKPYRLPTEAEWEYACRAGTATPFWSGTEPPEPGAANPWDLKNTHTGAREWCLDWYGPYPATDQVDPIGAASGMVRVVRGGALDDSDYFPLSHYARSTNRAGIAPSFSMMSTTKKPKTKSTESTTEKSVPGLIGKWYGNVDLTRAMGTEVMSTLEHNWSKSSEGRGGEWSAKWLGFLVAPATGEIIFHVAADHGAALEIDAKPLIQWQGQKGERSGSIALVKGREYPISVTYTHDGGAESYLSVRWSFGGAEKASIPADNLRHTAEQHRAGDAGRGDSGAPGSHAIGFRVVQAPMPMTAAQPFQAPFVQSCVKQTDKGVTQGPDPRKPWYRKRYLLPIPPENVPKEDILAAGLHPGFMRHNHSPGLEVCPNGDILMIIYTSEHEYEPAVSLMAARLRYGADRWDMPDQLFDFPDVNDHAPCLWNDNGAIHFFWGNPRMNSAYPFQWTSSLDNGATWSEVRFPVFNGEIGPHSRQPINTALRGLDGTMFVSSDGAGGTSVLWASNDNGETWYDTGGRSAGRHTSYVQLKGGSILGMGGKNTDIDGYMPKAISRDGGKTWEVSKTPFAALGSNQRPSVLRLQSGRLFFAGDFQHRETGAQPEGIKQRGSYVAISEDEGETWHIKKLVGAVPHETDKQAPTIGYSVARQAPNGVIHLITTMNHPSLHFELNEAWILSDAGAELSDNPRVRKVKRYKEKYPSGKTRAEWKAGTASDGRYLLHGPQAFYYEGGQKQWEVTYQAGRKVGMETYWARDGKKIWAWRHGEDGKSVWIQWWANGEKMSEATWIDGKCEGVARRWNPSGQLISEVRFVEGKVASE